MIDMLGPITGLLGSLGFSLVFNLRGKFVFFGALGGGLSWAAYLLFLLWTGNDFLSNMLAAMIVAIYSQVLARVIKAPVPLFLAASIIPMIPGGMLYDTMLKLVNQQWTEGLQKGVDTLLVAGAIAIGFALAASLDGLVKGLLDGLKRRFSHD